MFSVTEYRNSTQALNYDRYNNLQMPQNGKFSETPTIIVLEVIEYIYHIAYVPNA